MKSPYNSAWSNSTDVCCLHLLQIERLPRRAKRRPWESRDPRRPQMRSESWWAGPKLETDRPSKRTGRRGGSG
jgi:hypothetical protein